MSFRLLRGFPNLAKGRPTSHREHDEHRHDERCGEHRGKNSGVGHRVEHKAPGEPDDREHADQKDDEDSNALAHGWNLARGRVTLHGTQDRAPVAGLAWLYA